jgi:hypothetical protein
MKTCQYKRHASAGSSQDRRPKRPDPSVARRIRDFATLRHLMAGCSHPPGGWHCHTHGKRDWRTDHARHAN